MAEKPELTDEIRDYFRYVGAKYGELGGKATAAKMTKEERSEKARKMVAARKKHPLLSDEERARRAAIPKKAVGRPRLTDEQREQRKIERARKRKEKRENAKSAEAKRLRAGRPGRTA